MKLYQKRTTKHYILTSLTWLNSYKCSATPARVSCLFISGPELKMFTKMLIFISLTLTRSIVLCPSGFCKMFVDNIYATCPINLSDSPVCTVFCVYSKRCNNWYVISVVVIFDVLLTGHCAHKHNNVQMFVRLDLLRFDLVRSFHWIFC